MKFLILFSVVASLLGVGCDSNPDERTLIDTPRLLAVQSSPPALLGLEGVVNLRALSIDGDGSQLPGDEVQYRVCSPWEFLVDPNQDCPKSLALPVIGKELSTQEILDFYPPPSVGGDAIELAETNSTANCPPKAALEVPIVAELQIDGITLQTVKRVPFYLSEVRKRNPEIGEIEISGGSDGTYQLSIAIKPESLDLECRDEASVAEAIRIYLYSTSGSFESASVDLVPTANAAIDLAEVLWTSTEEAATLFFVAVDNDGGVAWKTLSL